MVASFPGLDRGQAEELVWDPAAADVGLGGGSVGQNVEEGSLPGRRPLRPKTARAYGYRGGRSQRTVVSGQLRRALFDVRDLDALVDRWKRQGDG